MRQINTSDKRFHNGNGRNEMGTIVTAEWLNAVQDELVNLVTSLGGRVDDEVPNQIATLLLDKLAAKSSKQHNHSMSDISGLSDALGAKAPLASPVLTGTPTAPTASQETNNTQIATTAFVKAAIAALVGSAPAALDTLQELANALGQDANFRNTVLNQIAGKANQSHTHSYSQISDFANGVASQFSYQKTENFEVFKYPDGSMIQIYKSNPILNHSNTSAGFMFNWAQAFTSIPALTWSVSSDQDAARDCWVTFNKSGTTNTKVKYWIFEGSYNTSNLEVNIIAIGRWK